MPDHPNISVSVLTRGEIAGAIDDLARLRISIFREFPYLYDGDAAYEAGYLKAYETSNRAIVVAARDGDQLVGAATGTPLSDHHDEFAGAFAATPYNMDRVFYCAESVLLPGYRGHGLGHVFFDEREAHARRLGYTHCCFCAVIRPHTHPARPDDYRPLDGFWRKRGYVRLDGVTAGYAWKDIGETRESVKPMQFWIREL